MKIIEGMWKTYRAMVVSPTAGAAQLDDTRKAFFAGAAALWAKLTGSMFSYEDGAEPSAEDLGIMALIQREVDEYGQELDKAVLEGAPHKYQETPGPTCPVHTLITTGPCPICQLRGIESDIKTLAQQWDEVADTAMKSAMKPPSKHIKSGSWRRSKQGQAAIYRALAAEIRGLLSDA